MPYLKRRNFSRAAAPGLPHTSKITDWLLTEVDPIQWRHIVRIPCKKILVGFKIKIPIWKRYGKVWPLLHRAATNGIMPKTFTSERRLSTCRHAAPGMQEVPRAAGDKSQKKVEKSRNILVFLQPPIAFCFFRETWSGEGGP